jgi:hypothetical protein
LRAGEGFLAPGSKGRSLDAFASGQGFDSPGAEGVRWANPESTQTGFEGSFVKEGKAFAIQSWLRLPAGATLRATAGAKGCRRLG